MDTSDLRRQLASAYYKLLTAIDWHDDVLLSGIREGLNKFLSNAYLGQFKGVNKYHKTDLISDRAKAKMEAKDYTDLVFEHLVPKQRHVQEPCENKAAQGSLKIEDVDELLTKYWRTATITKDEDALLSRSAMPSDWDGDDVLARYRLVGISLSTNPFNPSQAK